MAIERVCVFCNSQVALGVIQMIELELPEIKVEYSNKMIPADFDISDGKTLVMVEIWPNQFSMQSFAQFYSALDPKLKFLIVGIYGSLVCDYAKALVWALDWLPFHSISFGELGDTAAKQAVEKIKAINRQLNGAQAYYKREYCGLNCDYISYDENTAHATCQLFCQDLQGQWLDGYTLGQKRCDDCLARFLEYRADDIFLVVVTL